MLTCRFETTSTPSGWTAPSGGEEDTEYTTPDAAEKAPRTADTPLAELDLAVGAKVAYVFDFGDEWRVKLTLRAAMVATNEPA